MSLPVAVLDACILYSALLRDLLMRLAGKSIYFPKWTEQIHHEWIENVLQNRPELSRAKLERTRQLMELHAADSLVTGYEALIPHLILPDVNDRHVLAAAVTAQASLIITYNLSDFPKRALQPYGIAAQHPDVFLSSLFDTEPTAFLEALQEMLHALQNPPRTLEQHLDVMSEQGLHKTVERLATMKLQSN